MACLREGTVGLPDGRRLGYGEYGKRGGKPVLLFHGIPGGQFDLGMAVAEAGCWLFVLERPGIGLSDPKAGRKVLDWPIDVEVFVSHFGFDRFAVAGFSAGAPYALACGYALADRVPVVGLVCGYLAFADDPALDHLVGAYVGDRITRYRADPEAVRAELREENTEEANAWAADPDGFFRSRFGPMADSLPPFWLSMMSSTLADRSTPMMTRSDKSPWDSTSRMYRCEFMLGMATRIRSKRSLIASDQGSLGRPAVCRR